MDVWKHTDYLGGLKFGRFPIMEVPDRAFGRLGSLEVLRARNLGKWNLNLEDFGNFVLRDWNVKNRESRRIVQQKPGKGKRQLCLVVSEDLQLDMMYK